MKCRDIITVMVSLTTAALAANDKFCGKSVSRCTSGWCKNKYCCSKNFAWNTADDTCTNYDNGYQKIYSGCVTNRRRVKKVCCEKKNDRHDCPTPTTSPAPADPVASDSYPSSSSRYFPGDTGNTLAGQPGACGGAILDDVAAKLSTLTDSVGMHYFPVAIAQGMAQPMVCSTANEATGAGSPSKTGAGYANVLHTYCGQCVEFTTDSGTKVGGVVLDTCPTSHNAEWCSKDGNANQHGFYNHLDIYGTSESDVTSVIGSNPTGSVQAVTCPSEVTAALTSLAAATQQSPTSSVCNWYWDGSRWQGSPGMSDFGCSECSSSRRLDIATSVFV